MNKIFITLLLASIFIAAQTANTVCDTSTANGCTARGGTCSASFVCTGCTGAFGPALIGGNGSPANTLNDGCLACTVTDCATCPVAAATCTSCTGTKSLSTDAATCCALANCGTCASAATCTGCKATFSLSTDPTPSCCSIANCDKCPAAPGTCVTCKASFGKLAAGTCAACTLTVADTNCANCDGASQSVCSTCKTVGTLYVLDNQNLCGAVTNCGTHLSTDVTKCATCKTNFGKNVAGTACNACALTVADTNCVNCDGAVQTTCTACATVGGIAYSLDNQAKCGAIANCGTHAAGLTTCATCKTPGYTSVGTAGAYTACTLTVITPVYSTNSPQSGSFNTTPTVVFTSTDTSFSAISSMSPVYYTAGFTDATAYVWALKYTDATTAFTVARRQVNATFGAAFAKLNGSDTTLSTALTPAVTSTSMAKGPGYLGIFATVQNTALWNTATATAAEITLHYAAVNGSSFTAKAITGNTASTVYFDLLASWYDSIGIFYCIYAKHTHTVGTAAVADAWAYNGVYVQGVNVGTGALVYNSTGGVQIFAITTATSTNGFIGVTCGAVGQTCATKPSSPVSSMYAGGNNLTNSSVASYVYKDTTPTLDVVYYGTINLLTGAAGTAPTALATEPASVVSSATAAGSSTTYTPAGVLGSFATSGVFVNKVVSATPWVVATSTAGTSTYVYTTMAFINGSTTASAVVNVTVQSGYQMSTVMGYGTSDGFVLVETQASTASPATNPLTQYERIFTNGSASGSATSLGTYQDTVQAFQDGNGSILLGFTTRDTANGLTYQGNLGKTAIVQTLALGASTLTSIFAFLSLMIVALFAF